VRRKTLSTLNLAPAKRGIANVPSGMALEGAIIYNLCQISGQNSQATS
jgi:hypothetical protein